ncbi:MAG: hypothetical protein PWP23_2071 [Candidatus Sumerlaeota bacterium]|nr:hypothetical protein [Candidatus Sumerlaeota bacterium]
MEKGASGASVPSFRLRDLLLPQRLLALTDADDNPLLVFTRRRMARWYRFAGLRVFELLLLLAAFVLSAPSTPLSFFGNHRWWPGETHFMAMAAFAFGLLRYHLLLNDQSRHIKGIGRDQLEHLLLTRMTREDFFLHHLLTFCLRYRVVVAWALLVAFHFLYGMARGEYRWVEPGYFAPMVAVLFVVLNTWIAGVLQYVVEWRTFAGGRIPVYRFLVSLPISLGFALAIALLAMTAFISNFAGLFLTLGVFAVLVVFVYQYALGCYEGSMELLWDRFTGNDSDYVRLARPRGVSIGGMTAEVFFPWLWGRPARRWKEQAGESRPRVCAREWVLAGVAGVLATGLVVVGKGVLVHLAHADAEGSFSIWRFAHPIWALLQVPALWLAFVSWMRWRRSEVASGWGAVGPEIPRLVMFALVALSLEASYLFVATEGALLTSFRTFLMVPVYYLPSHLFGSFAMWSLAVGLLAALDAVSAGRGGALSRLSPSRLGTYLLAIAPLIVVFLGGGLLLANWLFSFLPRNGFGSIAYLVLFMVTVGPQLLAIPLGASLLRWAGMVRNRKVPVPPGGDGLPS